MRIMKNCFTRFKKSFLSEPLRYHNEKAFFKLLVYEYYTSVYQISATFINLYGLSKLKNIFLLCNFSLYEFVSFYPNDFINIYQTPNPEKDAGT